MTNLIRFEGWKRSCSEGDSGWFNEVLGSRAIDITRYGYSVKSGAVWPPNAPALSFLQVLFHGLFTILCCQREEDGRVIETREMVTLLRDHSEYTAKHTHLYIIAGV